MHKKVAGVVAGVVCLSALPVAADAAVRINEVAWMGTSDNANAEWIELFNTDDTPTTLTGWSLVSSTGSPSISITTAKTIQGKGYFLLERTAHNITTVPDYFLYTGALTNTGAILTLKDATGAIIDTVDGGTNWTTIGGDNTTKQTAQRSADGSSWNTSDPTPGAENTESTEESTSDTGTNSSTKVPTFPHIYIDGVGDCVVSTLDNLEPTVMVYDDDIHPVQYATIHWAFGDGSRDYGYHPTHTYQYPGDYVVDVRAQSNNLKAEDSFVVTVDDADIHITENSARGIALYNADDRTITLSKWILRLGNETYEIPEGTQILPDHTVIFPVKVTGLNVPSDQVTLMYPNKTVATTFVQTFAVKTFY